MPVTYILDKESLLEAIRNRAISERAKLESEDIANTIKSEIEFNVWFDISEK